MPCQLVMKMAEGFFLNQIGVDHIDQSLMHCTISAGNGSKFCWKMGWLKRWKLSSLLGITNHLLITMISNHLDNPWRRLFNHMAWPLTGLSVPTSQCTCRSWHHCHRFWVTRIQHYFPCCWKGLPLALMATSLARDVFHERRTKLMNLSLFLFTWPIGNQRNRIYPPLETWWLKNWKKAGFTNIQDPWRMLNWNLATNWPLVDWDWRWVRLDHPA